MCIVWQYFPFPMYHDKKLRTSDRRSIIFKAFRAMKNLLKKVYIVLLQIGYSIVPDYLFQ